MCRDYILEAAIESDIVVHSADTLLVATTLNSASVYARLAVSATCPACREPIVPEQIGMRLANTPPGNISAAARLDISLCGREQASRAILSVSRPGDKIDMSNENAFLRDASKWSQAHKTQVELTELSEFDSFRVALIPLAVSDGPPHHDTYLSDSTPPVVLLPLTWRELVAHLRTGGPGQARENNILKFGVVEIDLWRKVVTRAGFPVAITLKEFELLCYLIHFRERAISRDELLNEVWGFNNYPCTRTVDNHILQLRKKLEEDPSRPAHLLTVHGYGYKFVP